MELHLVNREDGLGEDGVKNRTTRFLCHKENYIYNLISYYSVIILCFGPESEVPRGSMWRGDMVVGL